VPEVHSSPEALLDHGGLPAEPPAARAVAVEASPAVRRAEPSSRLIRSVREAVRRPPRPLESHGVELKVWQWRAAPLACGRSAGHTVDQDHPKLGCQALRAALSRRPPQPWRRVSVVGCVWLNATCWSRTPGLWRWLREPCAQLGPLGPRAAAGRLLAAPNLQELQFTPNLHTMRTSRERGGRAQLAGGGMEHAQGLQGMRAPRDEPCTPCAPCSPVARPLASIMAAPHDARLQGPSPGPPLECPHVSPLVPFDPEGPALANGGGGHYRIGCDQTMSGMALLKAKNSKRSTACDAPTGVCLGLLHPVVARANHPGG
jgi:hypothetical protein